MNRRLQGSSSGAELNDARDVLPRISLPRGSPDEKKEFLSSNGHVSPVSPQSPEKKQVVDAGLKSLDHCMPTTSFAHSLCLVLGACNACRDAPCCLGATFLARPPSFRISAGLMLIAPSCR